MCEISEAERDYKIKIVQEEAKNKLKLSSERGDVELLYESIQLNPEILDGIEGKRFVDTPLHEAAKRGRTQFCAEMMNLMPSFGKKLNPQGLSPLHLALQNIQQEADATNTALALVDIDRELVRVKGRDGMTPLMYCAKSTDNNDIYLDILVIFLRDCPQSIYDRNTKSQTALHVALENNNCKAVVILLNWIQRTSNYKAVNWKDDKGNTPLHLAALHKCVPGVEILVKIALLNKRNDKGETPLNIAYKHNAKEVKIIQLLKNRNALTAGKLKSKLKYADYLKSPIRFGERAVKWYYNLMKDLNNEMRNMVLVVAVLIATATYTAILQPPGGVYQANATTKNTTSTENNTIIGRGALQIAAAVPAATPPPVDYRSHEGRMVMKDGDYSRFMPTNMLAFTLSVMVIIFVLPGKPYTIILHLCLLFLSHSCLIGMLFVSLDTGLGIPHEIFILCWSLIAFSFFLKMTYYLFVKGFFGDMWWMPYYYTRVSNTFQCISNITGGKKPSDEMIKPKDTAGNQTMKLVPMLRKQYKLVNPKQSNTN